MTETASTDEEAAFEPPKKLDVNQISFATVRQALASGTRDFKAAPVGIAVGLFFAIGGWLVFAMIFWLGYIYLAYPTAAGFALLGPFTATVLYDISRLLSEGKRPGWSAIGPALRTGRERLSWLPMITLFGFMIWLDVAAALYAIFFGLKEPNLASLLTEIVTTPTGVLFLIVGNAVGAFFAIMLFSISVMSYPLLMDQGVDAVTAILTSVKAVRRNPLPLIGYGALIAILLALSVVLGFLGLLVVMPILGHATWHLYRLTVVVVE